MFNGGVGQVIAVIVNAVTDTCLRYHLTRKDHLTSQADRNSEAK